MSDGKIRVLVVDDEPPARRRLRALLSAEPDVVVAGECGDGKAAVEMVRALRPDLVFLDVQMPEADGFEVVAALEGEMPAVVFVTAYDEHALRAFDVHALDYLLKPVDRDRFRATLERARRRLLERAGGLDPRLAALLGELRPRPEYLDRIAVRTGTRIRLVPVDEVDYVEADDNYVRVHAAGRTHLLRDTLAAMETRLDPARFVRVHRSLVVNLSRVVELEPLFGGEYVLTLRDGTKLTSGRTYRAKLQAALSLR